MTKITNLMATIVLLSAFAAQAGFAPTVSKCRVEVRFNKKSGETDTRVYRPKVKTKAACERAARGHQTNFAPHVVQSVAVTVRWFGS